jgi:hypothetical protein
VSAGEVSEEERAAVVDFLADLFDKGEISFHTFIVCGLIAGTK